MKKLIAIIIPLFVFGAVFGQGTYEKGMQKAFGHWKAQEHDAAVAMFERIAQAEDSLWVPPYYAANVLISSSFSIQDQGKRMATLEKAKKYIKMAHERSADNSEIITLEGMLYTGYVAMDPGTYGMQYSGKIMAMHEKAVTLDPENPRAWANKIEYEVGFAKFMNKDLKPFAAQMKEILPKFDNQKSDVAFAPTYGKERALQVIKECEGTSTEEEEKE